MNCRNNVWVCLSDLLAGLMAFFVFVSAGIYVEYLEMESFAFESAIITQDGNETKDGVVNFPLTKIPGVIMEGDGIKFAGDYFESDSCELTPTQRDELQKIIWKAGESLDKSEKIVKLLFVGHSSCPASTNATKVIDNYKNRTDPPKTKQEKVDFDLAVKKEIYASLFQHNYKLSLGRAFEVFKIFWANPEIKSNGEDNIRYIGMSERLAASKDGNLICSDEDREKGKRIAQSVEVFAVEEWPKIFEIQ